METLWRDIVQQALQSRPSINLPRNFKLPCLPQSVVEFTSISNNPAAGPKEMAVPIEADSALTSALLKQVNSAAVGLRQTVLSVGHAINLLGPRRTKTLVLVAALEGATAKQTSRLINNNRFQIENRIRAAFARHAATAIHADADVAYLAGLLQDFMLPLLTEAFYDDYVEFRNHPGDLVEKELARFGWDHATVAAMLMFDWGFPENLVACVLLHHSLERILSTEPLHATAASAAAAAASLPESLDQTMAGFEKLLQLQSELPDFSFMEVASGVDDEAIGGISAGHADSLCERLGKLAETTLEQRRLESLHQHRQLGNYILQDQIGQGAMGVIYRAQHSMLKRPAAIKVLRAGGISQSALAQFEAEVQMTCQLTSPHTVSVFDYGVTAEGLFYYVMEYLDGVTLGHIVRRTGPMPSNRVIHFLRQACSSLIEAHSHGMIHRDLKPENMMVCARGGIADTLKVLDFGLVTVMSTHPERDQVSAAMCGTPHYMSPESITAPDSVDDRADVYSLGAIGYFLLTGTTVFTATTIPEVLRSQVSEVPQRPSERLGSPIDETLENIILRCLSKSRDERPHDASELNQLLNRCPSAGTWDPCDSQSPTSPHEFAIPNDTANILDETCIAPVEC